MSLIDHVALANATKLMNVTVVGSSELSNVETAPQLSGGSAIGETQPEVAIPRRIGRISLATAENSLPNLVNNESVDNSSGRPIGERNSRVGHSTNSNQGS